VTAFGGSTIPVFSRPTQPGHPSVGIGGVSTGDGFGHSWGRNSEFCVAVVPATRTAGILAESG